MGQTGYLPRQPSSTYSPLKFCMQGRVLDLVIYLKFDENRSKALGAVGVVLSR